MTSDIKAQAAQILALSRRRISQICPSLLQAIYLLENRPIDLPIPMHTNGTQLVYHPQEVIDLFLADHDAPARALLHITAHCLLGHLECRQVKDTACFDLAADFKVYSLIGSLCPQLLSNQEVDHLDLVLLNHYGSHAPLPQFYQQLSQQSRTPSKELTEIFAVDDHDLWQLPPSIWQKVRIDFYQWAVGTQEDDSSLSVCPGFGHHSGTWVSDLRACINPHPRSYQDLLFQFFQEALVEQSSTVDIDPMWYHFGLDYLGDIPIIEPSEEALAPQFGTLVIAMDTSGSCDGEICRQFLSELSSLISTLEGMQATGRVVLVQCDTELYQETHITDLSQWPQIAQDFAPEGFGGTDFRPVFELAQSLEDVRGLIYLTDAEGVFPDQPTPFPTLFLLTDNSRATDIPNWIHQVAFATI